MTDRVILNSNVFRTIVAVSEEDHIRGLMYKKFPPPVMTFPYKTSEVRKFWMRNTISPLDIVFCNQGKIISICEGKPLSLDFVGPDEPIDLVVELPQGTCSNAGICIGDDVSIKYSVNTLAEIFKYSLDFSA